jgi:chorismate mutase
LFLERFELVKLIWIIKKENNIPLLQPDRFNSLLENLKGYAKNTWISSKFIENIWNVIHEESINIEK